MGEFRLALKMNPEFWFAHAEFGTALVFMSSIDEGMAEIEKAVKLSGHVLAKAELAYAYMAGNRRTDAERILRELKEISSQRYVPSTHIAMVYAVLGEKDSAFEWLNRAVQEGTSTISLLNERTFDGLRTDPRFQKLLERIGLA